jgi:hypothetical protein
MIGRTKGYFSLTLGFQKLAIKKRNYISKSNQTRGAIHLNALFSGNCMILCGSGRNNYVLPFIEYVGRWTIVFSYYVVIFRVTV